MGNQASGIGRVVTTPLKVVQNAADTARTISSIPLTTAKTTATTLTKVQSLAPKVVDVVGSKDTWNAIGDAGKGVIDAGKSVVDAGVSVAKETGNVAKGLASGTGNFLKTLEYFLFATLGLSLLGGAIYIVMEARKKEKS